MTVAPPPGPDQGFNGSSSKESTACRLASALRSLVARDDEPPPVWRTPAFADGVEAIRASLSGAHTPSVIDRAATVLLDGAARADWSFSLAAQRLARDPAAVAIAMRWLELDARAALPAWPDVVRRRALQPVRAPAARDVELWFG